MGVAYRQGALPMPSLVGRCAGDGNFLPSPPTPLELSTLPRVLQVDCGLLACLSIRLKVEFHFLPLAQVLHACTLDRADVNEYVFAAVIGSNEAKAPLAVEPLHSAYLCHHRSS